MSWLRCPVQAHAPEGFPLVAPVMGRAERVLAARIPRLLRQDATVNRIPLAICGTCAILNATGLATGFYRFHGPVQLKVLLAAMLYAAGTWLLARACRP